jgi:hypothetical protein
MKNLVTRWTFCIALMAPAPGLTQDEELSSKELSLQDRASQRVYPGGPDEEDLKVIDGVTSATAKIQGYQIEREVYQSLFEEEAQSTNDDE